MTGESCEGDTGRLLEDILRWDGRSTAFPLLVRKTLREDPSNVRSRLQMITAGFIGE